MARRPQPAEALINAGTFELNGGVFKMTGQGPDVRKSSSKRVYWVDPDMVLAQPQGTSRGRLSELYKELLMTTLLGQESVGPAVRGAVPGPRSGLTEAMFVQRGEDFTLAANAASARSESAAVGVPLPGVRLYPRTIAPHHICSHPCAVLVSRKYHRRALISVAHQLFLSAQAATITELICSCASSCPRRSRSRCRSCCWTRRGRTLQNSAVNPL